MTVLNVFQSKMSISEWKCGSSILIAFWYVFDYYLRLQITNASGHSTPQHSRHTVLNSSIRRTMPDESGAARLHIGLIDNLNARLPRHTPIACDGFITLGLWLSVSIRSRLSSLTSHLRYVKPKMLPLTLRVIAHLRAGTAHHPTIGNNVTPDPIFNCQVSVLIYLFISGHLSVELIV